MVDYSSQIEKYKKMIEERKKKESERQERNKLKQEYKKLKYARSIEFAEKLGKGLKKTSTNVAKSRKSLRGWLDSSGLEEMYGFSKPKKTKTKKRKSKSKAKSKRKKSRGQKITVYVG